MINHTLNHLKNCLILNNNFSNFDELLNRFGDYGMQADYDNILYLSATDAYFILDECHLILTNGNDEFFRYALKNQENLDKLESVLLINSDKPILDDIINVVNQRELSNPSQFLYEIEKLNHCQVEGFIIGFNAC